MFYHFWENLGPAVASWFPAAVGAAFGKGNLGVEVFFVLSGFVIAHSVRTGLHTWSYLGRFALRRSIRLDPALWLALAAEVALVLLTLRLFPAYDPALPSIATVAANATYLQNFLGLPHVVSVFWTLTYEVQFYLVLVLALVLWRSWGPRPGPAGPPWALVTALLLGSCAWSLSIYVELAPLPLRGLFIDRWYQFAVGIAIWLWFQRRMPTAALVPFFALLLAALPLAPDSLRLNGIAAIGITGLVLAGAVATGRVHDALAGSTWQFMGRISYSLYLIHLPVGWRFITLVREVGGPELGVFAGLFALVGAVAVSVGSAWTLYRLVEAPTVRLARRVSLPGAGSGGAAASLPSPLAGSSWARRRLRPD